MGGTNPQSLIFEETSTTNGRTSTRLVGAREDLKDFGPAWTKASTVKEFTDQLKKDLQGS